ncbi:hypothetical protein ABK040_004942 [Willaertia magna]
MSTSPPTKNNTSTTTTTPNNTTNNNTLTTTTMNMINNNPSGHQQGLTTIIENNATNQLEIDEETAEKIIDEVEVLEDKLGRESTDEEIQKIIDKHTNTATSLKKQQDNQMEYFPQKTNINHLPTEILIEICDFFTEPKDAFYFSITCHSFYFHLKFHPIFYIIESTKLLQKMKNYYLQKRKKIDVNNLSSFIVNKNGNTLQNTLQNMSQNNSLQNTLQKNTQTNNTIVTTLLQNSDNTNFQTTKNIQLQNEENSLNEISFLINNLTDEIENITMELDDQIENEETFSKIANWLNEQVLPFYGKDVANVICEKILKFCDFKENKFIRKSNDGLQNSLQNDGKNVQQNLQKKLQKNLQKDLQFEIFYECSHRNNKGYISHLDCNLEEINTLQQNTQNNTLQNTLQKNTHNSHSHHYNNNNKTKNGKVESLHIFNSKYGKYNINYLKCSKENILKLRKLLNLESSPIQDKFENYEYFFILQRDYFNKLIKEFTNLVKEDKNLYIQLIFQFEKNLKLLIKNNKLNKMEIVNFLKHNLQNNLNNLNNINFIANNNTFNPQNLLQNNTLQPNNTLQNNTLQQNKNLTETEINKYLNIYETITKEFEQKLINLNLQEHTILKIYNNLTAEQRLTNKLLITTLIKIIGLEFDEIPFIYFEGEDPRDEDDVSFSDREEEEDSDDEEEDDEDDYDEDEEDDDDEDEDDEDEDDEERNNMENFFNFLQAREYLGELVRQQQEQELQQEQGQQQREGNNNDSDEWEDDNESVD